MVLCHLTFALTEYYRYTKTFCLAHLNLSLSNSKTPKHCYKNCEEKTVPSYVCNLLLKRCIWQGNDNSGTAWETSWDNSWVLPVLTGFKQVWDRATADCNLGVSSCLFRNPRWTQVNCHWLHLGTVPQTAWQKECSSAGAARHNLSTAMNSPTANMSHLDCVWYSCSCL